MGNVLLWNTPSTFPLSSSSVICCWEPQMSETILVEKSLPEQCHKGLQCYSGGEEVLTVTLQSFTSKTLPKETWGREDSFKLGAKLKNLEVKMSSR